MTQKIEVGSCDAWWKSSPDRGWDGVTLPDAGAWIIYQGNGKWSIDTSSFGAGWTDCMASEFVSNHGHFDLSGGLFTGTRATWDGSCFRVDDGAGGSSCLETSAPVQQPPKPTTPGHWEHHAGGWVWQGSGKPTSPAPSLAPPVHSAPPAQPSPMPTSPPANASGPGRWEHKPKGWVWVNDSIVATAKEAMKSTAQQDIERGYTFYLCPIDEFGKMQACSAMTQAQAEIAVATAFATPVIAEDRKAGEIKPIDPLGKYGPRPTYPAGMLNALTVSLNQWHAINAAIAANLAAGTPTPPTTPGTAQDSEPTPIEKHVNFGVRILEGLAALAGVVVAVKLWKSATRKRAA